MSLDWEDEYETIIEYLSEKTGVFFWFRPNISKRYKQYTDMTLKKNIKNRVNEGVTTKQVFAAIDRNLPALPVDMHLKRLAIVSMFSKKKFWDEA